MSRSSVASKLSFVASNPFLVATREALPWSFAGLVAGALAIFPFVPSASLGLRVAGALVPAFGVMGLVLAPALGWFYARRAGIDPIPTILGATLAYLIALPPYAGTLLGYLRDVGPGGLFIALGGCALVALGARLGGNAWIGAGLAIATAGGLRVLHVSVSDAIAYALKPLGALGDTYLALIVIVAAQTLLWTIGLHGPALLAAFVTPVYLQLQAQNTLAFQNHQPLPHIVVVSLFLFIFPGGAGSTLPLAGLLAFSGVRRLRTIGRATILPAVFNMNEPLIFSVPVVLNPFLVPPFLAAPLVLATTTYLAVALGWVGRAIYYVPSSIPTLISTYVATLDLRALALVALNVAIATAIYWPFVRAYERHVARELEAAA